MRFDIADIAPQIREMIEAADPSRDAHRYDVLRKAWSELDSRDVSDRFRDAKTTFLIPGPHSDFKGRSALPDPVHEITVAATDGSFILPSRHSPARYYVLNTGNVVLRYGENSSADIWAKPTLYFRDEDLAVPDDIHHIPISGSTIGPKRAADELAALASILETEQAPAIGLQDGTLILWSLETLPDAVREWVLPDFVSALIRIRETGHPVASYISAPGSSELRNTLRIAVCDYPPSGRAVNCDDCRGRIKHGHQPACDVLPQVSDRFILEEIAGLEPGERTSVLESQSRVLSQYEECGDHTLRIHFFYLNVGWEIGRVEVPAWVANDRAQLDLVHRAIYDQAQLGRGYPVALQESHEAAVLNVSDRRTIEDMIERELAQLGIVLRHTGKDGSKRVRIV